MAFPIGLFFFSLVCDLIGLGHKDNPTWGTVAYYTMISGIVGALLAALPGFVDLFSLQDPETKGTGVRHMTINLIVVVLFVIDAWMRRAGNTSSLALIISVVGVLLLVASGWLGGEMVYVHGVAVAPQSPVPKSTR